ncbi:MAG: hypothetical protein MMC23_009014 [Stictis urceolatum]|nr:hypothetical protein [Stictis urceolata]
MMQSSRAKSVDVSNIPTDGSAAQPRSVSVPRTSETDDPNAPRSLSIDPKLLMKVSSADNIVLCASASGNAPNYTTSQVRSPGQDGPTLANILPTETAGKVAHSNLDADTHNSQATQANLELAPDANPSVAPRGTGAGAALQACNLSDPVTTRQPSPPSGSTIRSSPDVEIVSVRKIGRSKQGASMGPRSVSAHPPHKVANAPIASSIGQKRKAEQSQSESVKRTKESASSTPSCTPSQTGSSSAIHSAVFAPPPAVPRVSDMASFYTLNGGPVPEEMHRFDEAQQEKGWSSRHWYASQYYDLAEMAWENFPMDAFMKKHGKSKKEVDEVFRSVIDMPLLAKADRGPRKSRGGLGEDMVKERRQKEALATDIQREAYKQVNQNLPAITRDVRKKVTAELRDELKQQVYVEIRAQGYVAAAEVKNTMKDIVAKVEKLTITNNGSTENKALNTQLAASPEPNASSSKSRKAPPKSLATAHEELEEACKEVARAKKADEAKAKKAAKKGKDTGEGKGKGKVAKKE